MKEPCGLFTCSLPQRTPQDFLHHSPPDLTGSIMGSKTRHLLLPQNTSFWSLATRRHHHLPLASLFNALFLSLSQLTPQVFQLTYSNACPLSLSLRESNPTKPTTASNNNLSPSPAFYIDFAVQLSKPLIASKRWKENKK